MGTFFSSWSTPLLLKKGRAAAALLVLLEKLEFVILARVLVRVGGWGEAVGWEGGISIGAQKRVHCLLSIFVSQPNNVIHIDYIHPVTCFLMSCFDTIVLYVSLQITLGIWSKHTFPFCPWHAGAVSQDDPKDWKQTRPRRDHKVNQRQFCCFAQISFSLIFPLIFSVCPLSGLSWWCS